jgi:hypothetical protein
MSWQSSLPADPSRRLLGIDAIPNSGRAKLPFDFSVIHIFGQRFRVPSSDSIPDLLFSSH